MNKKQKTALILNICILILVIVGCILSFGEIHIFETKAYDHGIRLLKFFTVQSNILAGITSLLYIIFLVREVKTKKETPVVIHILRYLTAIDLVITFLVVALFLGFIAEDGYFSLYLNSNFLFHFLVPILNIISFAFFEKAPRFRLIYTFIGLTHLIAYAIFYLTNVIIHYHDGEVELDHDWYAFAHYGLGIAFACAFIILGLGYLISYLLYLINHKQNKLVKSEK